jgi:hypothetical protein
MTQLQLLGCAAVLLGVVVAGFGQGTAFLYQGQLTANGSPATGSYDLTFTLCNAGGSVCGTLTNPATAVSNGLFCAALDFGPGVFSGASLWLQIGVRSNGGGAFIPLAPMQPVLPAPYAITAANLTGPLPASQLSGAYPGIITFGNAANSFAGVFAGDGGALSNVDAALLGGLAGSNYATLDVLTNYATVASPPDRAASSPIPNMQVFDAAGTTQFTIPASVTRIAVEVWGGGGGGGNANSSAPGGGGGGAGGYGKGVFTVAPGSNYTVVVGVGGGAAVSGGASSFGALISAGGGSAGPNAPANHGGAGGVGGGTINITGGAGQWSTAIGCNNGGSAGNGGSGGAGDTLVVGSYTGGSGQTPGGGGGGGYDGNDSGGSGGHGRVIVYY